MHVIVRVGLRGREQVLLPLDLLLHVLHVSLGDEGAPAKVTALEQILEDHQVLVDNDIFGHDVGLVVEVDLLVLEDAMAGVFLEDLWVPLPLLYLFLTEGLANVPLGGAIDPAHGQLARADNGTAVLDQHEAFRLVTLSLDVLPFAEKPDVQIRYQGQQMVSIDRLEEVNSPEELQPLLEQVVLHALANYEHRLQFVDEEEVTRLARCRCRALLVQFVHLLVAQVFKHVV